jgi:hypothetical protein
MSLFFKGTMSLKTLVQNFQNTLKLMFLRTCAQRNPVYILQMGRVGSVSVSTAVTTAYQAISLNVPVYHRHYISSFDLIVERILADLEHPSPALQFDRQLRDTLLNDIQSGQPIKIISLVRDPVARNVSTFFYALPQFISDWKEKEAQQLLFASELSAIFESKQHFIQTALNWFDEQIKDAVGLDVYAVPFDKTRGWQIYKQGLIELLVLRMEDLQSTGEDALRKFLNLPHLKMVKVNTGEEREAFELYRRFLTHPVSREYLEMSYSTKLARHFYTDKEIEQFTDRWRNPQPIKQEKA